MSELMVKDAMEWMARKVKYHSIWDVWNEYSSPTATPADPYPTLLNAANYFCTDPTPLDIETIQLMILGMVFRGYDPGYEFQFMPILLGETRTRKSTTLERLAGGREFFNDGFPAFDLKDHAKLVGERSAGCVLLEYPELKGAHKVDIEVVKSFISSNSDTYRSAYARETKTHPNLSLIHI